MGNSLNKTTTRGAKKSSSQLELSSSHTAIKNRSSTSFNCFNTSNNHVESSRKIKKLKSGKKMKQSISYDSSSSAATRGHHQGLFDKMKNRFKNRNSNSLTVQRSRTDQNLLVIQETNENSNIDEQFLSDISRKLNSIKEAQRDEYDDYDNDYNDDLITDMDHKNNLVIRYGKFTKSPALYNIQSFMSPDIKISDLINADDSTSYTYDNNDNVSIQSQSSEPSISMSSLSIISSSSANGSSLSPRSSSETISNEKTSNSNSNRFTELFLPRLETNNNENCSESEGLKFIDESMSCILKTESSCSSKSLIKLRENETHNSSSFKLLKEVNTKLCKLHHIKKMRNLIENRILVQQKIVQRSSATNVNCLIELRNSSFACDDSLKDNLSVYTLSYLNKAAPLAASESTILSFSFDNLKQSSDCNFSRNSNNFSMINSIANLSFLNW